VTQGNNVKAYLDLFKKNSGTPVSLLTDRTSLNLGSTAQVTSTLYRQAAVSNLFYWNNIMHDILYQYGFNEASGNFQENNFNKGGKGSDSVQAEAQVRADPRWIKKYAISNLRLIAFFRMEVVRIMQILQLQQMAVSHGCRCTSGMDTTEEQN